MDEETGIRGYEITSDPRFLDPYRKAQAPLQEAIADQLRMVTGTGVNIKAFIVEHEAWHSGFAEPLIAMVAAGGEASDIDLNLTGKHTMDSMRTHLENIVTVSEQRRAGQHQ